MTKTDKKINYRRVEEWADSHNKDINDFIVLRDVTFKVLIPIIATNDSTKEEIVLLPGITYECPNGVQMIKVNDINELTCNVFLFLDIKIDNKYIKKLNWGVFAYAEANNVEVEITIDGSKMTLWVKPHFIAQLELDQNKGLNELKSDESCAISAYNFIALRYNAIRARWLWNSGT